MLLYAHTNEKGDLIKSVTKSPAGVEIYSYNLFDTQQEAEESNENQGKAHGFKQGEHQIRAIEVIGCSSRRALPRSVIGDLNWH